MRGQTRARRERLNMRIPVELLGWAKGYVVKKNTTVTQLFVDFLTHLKEKDHGSKNGVEHRPRSSSGL
jgi:hypothetical protein